MSNEYLDKSGLTYLWGKLKAYFQPKLVSGTNIKTINDTSLLGSGNISIEGGGSNNVFYGTCSTGASTVAKAVVCEDFSSSDLVAGAIIFVKFTNAQTASAPTLNVNSTGAKNIKRVGTTNAAEYEWVSGETLCFTYDGSYWVLTDGGLATTSYYGVTKLSSSTSSTSTTLAATPSAVKAAYDLANSGTYTPTASTLAKFDSTAHMNSTDMTDAQIETYLDDIDYTPTVVNDTVPIGAIQAFGGANAPKNWLICDGSAISRTTYAKLFSVIGTTYGTGDGSTTFNLPDLKGRTLIGVGNSGATGATNHTLGQKSGEEKHTLSVNEMPSHQHSLCLRTQGSEIYGIAFDYGAANGGWFTGGYIEAVGGSQAHNNMQPYVVTNYIIKYDDKEISGNQLKSIEEYLYEEGTSGIWTYRKWNSGIAECWGVLTRAVNLVQGPYGGSYYGNTTITFPSDMFIAEPQISCTRQGRTGTGLIGMSIYISSKDSFDVSLWNPGSSISGLSYGISTHARGRWK